MSERTPIVGLSSDTKRQLWAERLTRCGGGTVGVALIANGVLQLFGAAFATYFASSISPPGRSVCGDDESCLNGRFMRGDVVWLESLSSDAFVCYLGAIVTAFAGLLLYCLPRRTYNDHSEFDLSNLEDGVHHINVANDVPVVFTKKGDKVDECLPLACCSPPVLGGKLFGLSVLAFGVAFVVKLSMVTAVYEGFHVRSELGNSNDCNQRPPLKSQFCDDYNRWLGSQTWFHDWYVLASIAFDMLSFFACIWSVAFCVFDGQDINGHLPTAIRGEEKK